MPKVFLFLFFFSCSVGVFRSGLTFPMSSEVGGTVGEAEQSLIG